MEQPKKANVPENRKRSPSDSGLQRKKRGSSSSGGMFSGMINTFSYILLILGVSLIISAFAIVVGNDVFALVKTDKTITLTVAEDSGTGKIAGQLRDYGIIKYSWAFRLFAGLKKVNTIPAGEYQLDAGMDYGQLISAMTGATDYRDTVTLTIPEGYTLKQIAELMEKSKVCKQKDFLDTANNYDFAHFMLKDVPMEENRLEGYLFPDTYEFYVGDNSVNVINKMLNNFVKKYTKSMRELTEKQGLTIAEVVNVASLVEKEAKLPDERTTISGVIYNRLSHSDKYPYLDIDASLYYVLGYSQKLTAEDLKMDSPYNTYTTKGLPPTAICNPGLACIMAAIQPENHSYYYYVADPKDGSHLFSKTLEEHNRAVAKVNGQ